jgi:hypothetical protein
MRRNSSGSASARELAVLDVMAERIEEAITDAKAWMSRVLVVEAEGCHRRAHERTHA